MLPRRNRIHRTDFSATNKEKRTTTEHFSCTRADSLTLKVGIIISKKTAKKSTDRHLLKRRISAVVEKIKPQKAKYMIYARKGSETLTYAKIETEITKLLTF